MTGGVEASAKAFGEIKLTQTTIDYEGQSFILYLVKSGLKKLEAAIASESGNPVSNKVRIKALDILESWWGYRGSLEDLYK